MLKYCLHMFEMNEKFFLLDYNNLLFFEVDHDTFDIVSMKMRGDQNDLSIKYNQEFIDNVNAMVDTYAENGILLVEKDYIFKEDKCNDTAYISFPTSNECNLNCRYCFAGACNDNKCTHMSEEMVEKILCYFVNKYQSYKHFRIDFVSGGEPLIGFSLIKKTHKVMQEICPKDKDFMIMVVTNGLLLTENIYKFADNNNIVLGISIDGDQVEHDYHRPDKQNQGSYAKVIANYSRLVNATDISRKTRDIWVLTVISSKTKSLVDILKHHRSIGATRVQMKIVRLKSENQLSLNVDNISHFVQIYGDLCAFFRQEIQNNNSLDYLLMILNENDYFGKIIYRLINREPVIRRCQAGQNKITITAEGFIYPCDSFAGVEQFLLGNIYDQSDANETFNNSTIYDRSCANCWGRHMCGGDCYHNSYLCNSDIHMPSQAFCMLTRKMIEMGICLLGDIQEHEKNFEFLLRFVKMKSKQGW